MGQLCCSCFKDTSIIPIKDCRSLEDDKIIHSPIFNNSETKYSSFNEDPNTPASIMSSSPRSDSRSPYPDLRIKIPVDKEIYFDDDNRVQRSKKNRLC